MNCPRTFKIDDIILNNNCKRKHKCVHYNNEKEDKEHQLLFPYLDNCQFFINKELDK